jgi:hypothetical protein
METKKTVKKVVKPKVDLRLQAIEEIESKLNSLPFGERIVYSGKLKSGKLDLSKLK